MLPLIEADLPVLLWLEAAAGGVAAPCISCAAVVPASDGVAVDGLVSGDGTVVWVPIPCEPWRALEKSLLLPTLLLWLATRMLSASVVSLPLLLRLVGPELLPTLLLQVALIVGLSQDCILLPWIVIGLVPLLLPLLWLLLLRSCIVLWLGLAGSVRTLLQGCCYQLFHLCFSEDGCSCCLLIGCCCFLVEWAHSLITLCHGLGSPCRVRCGG